MMRSIERRRIFRSDEDRDDLSNRLEALALESQAAPYAWALTANQTHRGETMAGENHYNLVQSGSSFFKGVPRFSMRVSDTSWHRFRLLCLHAVEGGGAYPLPRIKDFEKKGPEQQGLCLFLGKSLQAVPPRNRSRHLAVQRGGPAHYHRSVEREAGRHSSHCCLTRRE